MSISRNCGIVFPLNFSLPPPRRTHDAAGRRPVLHKTPKIDCARKTHRENQAATCCIGPVRPSKSARAGTGQLRLSRSGRRNTRPSNTGAICQQLLGRYGVTPESWGSVGPPGGEPSKLYWAAGCNAMVCSIAKSKYGITPASWGGDAQTGQCRVRSLECAQMPALNQPLFSQNSRLESKKFLEHMTCHRSKMPYCPS